MEEFRVEKYSDKTAKPKRFRRRRILDLSIVSCVSRGKSELGNCGQLHADAGRDTRGIEARAVMVNAYDLRPFSRVLPFSLIKPREL